MFKCLKFCHWQFAFLRLYPGQGFEAYVDSVIAGADLLGYKAEKKKQPTGCSQAMFIEANVEDLETGKMGRLNEFTMMSLWTSLYLNVV